MQLLRLDGMGLVQRTVRRRESARKSHGRYVLPYIHTYIHTYLLTYLLTYLAYLFIVTHSRVCMVFPGVLTFFMFLAVDIHRLYLGLCGLRFSFKSAAAL